MKKLLALPLLFAALIAGAGSVHAAPTPVDENGLLPGGIFCEFDVSYKLTGKTNTVTNRNRNVTTITSPGQRITLTNEETDESVSYVITGVRREVTTAGVIETVVTGRNIVVNSPDSDRQGIYVLVGDFNYAITTGFEEVRVFSGAGQVIDVCAALS